MHEQEHSLTLKNVLVAAGEFNPQAPTTSVELGPGQVVTLPTSLLLEAARSEQSSGLGQSATGMTPAEGMTVIPVIAEELVITKKIVPVETVRLVTTTEQVAEKVDVGLDREHWEVTRVPKGLEVQERSPVRVEGETTVYPLFEERLVARKALFLTEEVHVRKTVETVQGVVEAELRREVLTVERTAR